VGLPVDPPFNNAPQTGIPGPITPSNIDPRVNPSVRGVSEYNVFATGFAGNRLLLKYGGNCFFLNIFTFPQPANRGAGNPIYYNPPYGYLIRKNTSQSVNVISESEFARTADHSVENEVGTYLDPFVNTYGWADRPSKSNSILVEGYQFDNLEVMFKLPSLSFVPFGANANPMFTVHWHVWTDTTKQYNVSIM
jgi:hypothetical protein